MGNILPRKPDVWLWSLFVVAGILRLYLAATTPYFADEQETYLPAAASISLDPENPNLPIRLRNHPALVAYVVRVSTELFGESRLGQRALHVTAGMLALLLLTHMARQWYGPVAGRWTLALLAFNEYHLRISSIASSHTPYLLFVALALYAAQRLLKDSRPRYWYAMSAAIAIAFYGKETSALFLLVAGAALVWLDRRWWRSPHPYLAALLFGALVAPDIAWNLAAAGSERVTYADHLARIGGLGLSAYPLGFYVRSLTNLLPESVFMDFAPEYETTNAILGLSMLAAVVYATVRSQPADRFQRILLVVFWTIFGFFTLIGKGDPGKDLDPVAWFWAEMTLLPAVIITGRVLAADHQRWTGVTKLVVVVGLMYAVYAMLTPLA